MKVRPSVKPMCDKCKVIKREGKVGISEVNIMNVMITGHRPERLKGREKVVEKAKEAASEKFNDSLEDVLNEFKERLNSITKVYKSIEETFSSKASGDKAIKLVM